MDFQTSRAKVLRLFKTDVQIFEDKAQKTFPSGPVGRAEDRCDLLTLGLAAATFF